MFGKHLLLVLAGDCLGGRVDVLGGERSLVLNGLDTVLPGADK